MQKTAFAFFMLLMLLLSACGGDDKENNANQDNESTEQADNEQINVDKGLLNVEITLPASMFEGEDIEKVIADAKADGVDEVTQNEDGSLTYKMSKAKHREMMKDMETTINETIEDMKTSEEYPTIKDVTHNKDYSEFTLTVDRAAFEKSMDGFAIFGLGITGAYYHMFSGKDEDDYKITISLKDEATGEVFDKTVLPDDLESEETAE